MVTGKVVTYWGKVSIIQKNCAKMAFCMENAPKCQILKCARKSALVRKFYLCETAPQNSNMGDFLAHKLQQCGKGISIEFRITTECLYFGRVDTWCWKSALGKEGRGRRGCEIRKFFHLNDILKLFELSFNVHKFLFYRHYEQNK